MTENEIILLITAAIVALVVYFIPSIVAFNRGHENKMAILVINTFFGWSLIGWVGALVWAVLVMPWRD